MRSQRNTVFVGMSGGVDSSVSAAILKKQDYNVTGVFIKVWQPDFFDCGWKDDRLDAMRVCATLGIPFRELDLEQEYKKEVVDYMIAEYRAGKTPNPDVACNRFIKFGAFYKWARKEGADFVATGHYAQILPVKDKRLRIKDVGLFAGADPQKDQTYFLWQIRREQLSHILFPVGGMQKSEVRKLARKFGLVTAEKKDSQGLCFVGKVDMKEFLSHYITPKEGRVLLAGGNGIGTHDGAFFYTIGERIGLAAQTHADRTRKNAETLACYVVAKDIRQNTVTVSQKNHAGLLAAAAKTEFVIHQCNWLSEPNEGKVYRARIRYRQALQKCTILFPREGGRSPRQVRVHFVSAQHAAPGQSLVLYDGDICMGGGAIA